MVAIGIAIGGALGIGAIQHSAANEQKVPPLQVDPATSQPAPAQPVAKPKFQTDRQKTYLPERLFQNADVFACNGLRVVDGDTIRCGSIRVRLASIDAPELPSYCNPGRSCSPGDPYASTDNLSALVAGANVQCRKTDVDRYGRIVALCSANGRDLSCAQYQGGFAVERYGRLTC